MQHPYEKLFQDDSIEIPPEEFSVLNSLSQAVVVLDKQDRADLQKSLKTIVFKDKLASAVAKHLIAMENDHPKADQIDDRAQLLAAYLFDSAVADAAS